MNAFIFIRQFTIFVEDKHVEKKIREVVKPELVFYKDYNFLIYFKVIMIRLKISSKIIVEEIDFSEFFESFDFDDDFSDVENS